MPLVPNYAPTDWVDGVTPVNEARMDNIDTNLDLHADAINTLDTRVAAEEAMPDIPTVVNGQWLKGSGGALVWAAIAQADVTGLVAALAAKEATANKGVASGYAPLDATSKVPAANLPTPIDLRWMGNYAGATAYKEGDVVISNGISYMALRPTTGETPVAWSTGGGGVQADVQVFTASGTWVKPSGITNAFIFLIGGGGGGGGGRLGTTSTNRCGGGGGGGGGYAFKAIAATVLGANENVVVGAGGSFGAGTATTNTDGGAGGAGGVSSFGSISKVGGGGGGAAGQAAATATGGAAGIGDVYGGAGGAGAPGGGSAGVTTVTSGAGGGGGGGATSGNAEGAGGVGGSSAIDLHPGGSVGAVGPNAGGAGGSAAANEPQGGAGGGGGGGGHNRAGGAGGASGTYGAGGGGGGGSTNASSSGAGAVGKAGIVVVISW